MYGICLYTVGTQLTAQVGASFALRLYVYL